jgi:hypothetical protein
MKVFKILSGILMTAMLASAATVTYSTNSALTSFAGDDLSLTSSSGAVATLTFDPVGATTVGLPSNIGYGGFVLTCPGCSTQAGGVGATFSPFTFNLVVTDTTTGSASGTFVGTSTGGSVWSDVSQVVINWVPGTLPALNGSLYTIVTPSLIVAPNSGDPIDGLTSVVGIVTAAPGQQNEVPEPATFAMMGGSLMFLGLLRRRVRTEK